MDTQKTVAEIALEGPQAAAVFEKLGIDYCCNGRKPLAEACATAGIDVNRAIDLLAEAGTARSSALETGDWNEKSLTSLVNHILEKHHTFVRSECLRLEPLLTKVVSKHGDHHPELAGVQQVFAALREELGLHMMKEERMLFPYIIALENSATQKSAPPFAPFGKVQNPVRMMMLEHDNAGSAVKEIRKLTNNLVVPEDACTSFKALYLALEAFEVDLHRHIHLENNLLFPRALELEEKVRVA